ncbi:transposable element Tcb1 transposase [Trichonephila clavipes]|nr:transposable element Tcb1 transposase [Trichonephila clavipes]
MSSSPVPLKTRRVGQRCTLNLSRAETSSRWYGVVVRRGGASSATRGLLATDHVILNHGQVTWTTPELAPPLLTTTPHQREDVSALDRFNVHRCPTRRVFSGTGLEPVTKQATVRYLYHSATAATGRKARQKPFINGKPYVWRKLNEELRRQNLKPTVKHGDGSVTVWGSFSAAGPGTLHFIEGRMDQNVYLDILKTNLPRCVQKLSLGNNWRFYQDNDPKHKAYKVRSWLLYNCPHDMETPTQSLDINPIENLWDHLNKNVREHAVSSKTELKRLLLQEWDSIQPNFCEKLVQYMPKRLKMVMKNKGLHTKY